MTHASPHDDREVSCASWNCIWFVIIFSKFTNINVIAIVIFVTLEVIAQGVGNTEREAQYKHDKQKICPSQYGSHMWFYVCMAKTYVEYTHRFSVNSSGMVHQNPRVCACLPYHISLLLLPLISSHRYKSIISPSCALISPEITQPGHITTRHRLGLLIASRYTI